MFGEWALNQISVYTPGFWLLASLVGSLVVLYAERRWTRLRWRMVWAAHRVLIPYLGLLLGGLSPRLMGLNRLDWNAGLSIGLILMFAVTLLLILVRATVDLPDPWEKQQRGRAGHAHAGNAPVGAASVSGGAGGATQLPVRQSLLATMAIAGVREFQWVFLRGAIWEMSLTLPTPPEVPGYWAVWLAAALVLVEVLARRLSFAHSIFQLVILVCTSVLFFYTLNFWLCWVLHAIAQIIAAPTALPRAMPHIGWGRAPR
ncbi:MAG: hypothetical protein WDZ49_01995 [Litorilinea sp.]